MLELERRRSTVVDRLGTAYARGHLATDSLEFRLGEALLAADPGTLAATLWGLPGRTRPRAARLRLGSNLLVPGADRDVWVVGRSRRSDLRLADPAVSALHARVACRGGRWTVADLGSTNGTWVNGEDVQRAVLVPGDELRLGDVSDRLEG